MLRREDETPVTSCSLLTTSASLTECQFKFAVFSRSNKWRKPGANRHFVETRGKSLEIFSCKQSLERASDLEDTLTNVFEVSISPNFLTLTWNKHALGLWEMVKKTVASLEKCNCCPGSSGVKFLRSFTRVYTACNTTGKQRGGRMKVYGKHSFIKAITRWWGAGHRTRIKSHSVHPKAVIILRYLHFSVISQLA